MMNANSAKGGDGSLRKLRRVIEIPAPPEEVFEWLDEPLKTGSHMQGGAMGVKLKLEILSRNHTGVGAAHRWYGRAMGLTVDYTTVVTHWVRNREKVYHTVGSPKIVIMSGFEMRWTLDPTERGTKVTIDFGYDPPRSWTGRFLNVLVGRRYDEWCLNMIVGDAQKPLGASPTAAA